MINNLLKSTLVVVHSALITVSMPNKQINKQNKQLNISKHSVHTKHRQLVYSEEILVLDS